MQVSFMTPCFVANKLMQKVLYFTGGGILLYLENFPIIGLFPLFRFGKDIKFCPNNYLTCSDRTFSILKKNGIDERKR